jgi:phage/plasmid-like protein (TIGR03299 family)
MPDATIQVQPGDDVRGYCLLFNAHDGTSALRAYLTPVRVVCQNTLNAALGTKHTTAVCIRHTKSAPDQLKQAADVLSRMQEAMQATGDTYRALAARGMNARELAAYIEAVIPSPKDETPSDTLIERRAAIADLIFHGRHVQDGGADARTGYATAWRAYNAVTEYFDHYRPKEAKSDSARMKAYDSALFGGNAQIKAAALRELVAA